MPAPNSDFLAIAAGGASTFAIRRDCNGNLIGDGQDIDNGTSEDLNGNGIPDECEELDPCPWDITGGGGDPDGNVNLDDLLALLANWGRVSDTSD